MNSSGNSSKHKTKIALLLTGGGARAAYQVGVLKAIAKNLPRNKAIPFSIINGTSAGAINATALACYASCYQLGVKKLEYVWKNFHTEQVYHSNFTSVFGHILANMLRSFQSNYENHPPASLFNNQPLRGLLRSVLDLKRIDNNIRNDYLEALSITASSYSSGDSVAFFQSKHAESWQRAKRRGEKTTINIEHLMASSAIPMVFPSTKIRQGYFGDGSVHQHAPLSPAIHLGAEKVFVIGVEQPIDNKYFGFQPHYPGISTIAGHLLDTIFSDTLRADIERLERINRTLSLIPAKDKHKELKRIAHFVINPSQNFNAIATEYYDVMPTSIKLLLRSIGVKKHSESSLVSYLLFEKEYTQHLIEIGYQDGLSQLDEIMAFLEFTNTQ
jgi:NTE family protein